jgi:hypothetical protein
MLRESTRIRLHFHHFLLAIALASAGGCGGGSGDDGENALVNVEQVGAGDECADGGFRISSGVDSNGDGELGEDEVANETLICNGVDGVAGDVGQPGVAGQPGPSGQPGTTGDEGETGEQGETGTAGEDAHDLLTVTTELPKHDDNCPHGGYRVDVGLDDGEGDGKADDGVLHEDEIDDRAFICNGEPVYTDEPVEPPAGPDGTYTIIGDGGDSTGEAPSGGGGYLGADLNYGSSGGHIMLFETGQADAGFTVPDVKAFLGDEPLNVTENLVVPVLAAGVHDALSDGDVHQHTDDSGLYIYDDAASDHRLVTGLHVADGVTLTLGVTHAVDIGLNELSVTYDVHNEGTIQARLKEAKGLPTGSRPDLTIHCDNFIGAEDSLIDQSGGDNASDIGGDGGYVKINAQNGSVGASHQFGSIYNRGIIDTSGGDGLGSGGPGEYISLNAKLKIYNTGDLTSSGGKDTAADEKAGGHGGVAGYIEFRTQRDDIANSGTLRAQGGDGYNAGADGNYVMMSGNSEGRGRVLNSGDIYVDAGSSNPGCKEKCGAGDAGYLQVQAYGGDIVNSGNVSARGGDEGNMLVGRAGGYIQWETFSGRGWYGGYVPTGSIYVSGNLDVSGGTGASGGSAGYVYAYCDASDTPLNQEIVFLGYDFIRFNGGEGYSGGSGGYVELYHRNDDGGDYYVAPRGGIYNYVEVRANGGAATNKRPGRGGYFKAVAQPPYTHPADASVVHNYAPLTLYGGEGRGGGPGGYVVLSGPNGVENHGRVRAYGGKALDTIVGGGHRQSPAFLMVSELGPAVNTGNVDISGGPAEKASVSGGPGGTAEIIGASVDNSGKLDCAGGDGHATKGEGGDGGNVFLDGKVSGTTNSGDLDVSGGSANIDGDPGQVIIDGVNVTDDYI